MLAIRPPAWADRPPRDDPGLVTDAHLLAFRAWLEAAGLAPSTVAKTWRNLRAVFRRLGPRETGNPQGLGLLAACPAFTVPRVQAPRVRILTPAELGGLGQACDVATWPRSRATAAAAWRALLAVLFVHGLRIGDAVALPPAAVVRVPELPEQPGLANPSGWLFVDQRKTGKRYWLPLLPETRGHLDALARPDAPYLFPFGGRYDGGSFKRAWAEIRERAGLRGLKLHALRATSNMAWEAIRPGLGAWVLGHAQAGINARYYTERTRELVDASGQFAVPYPLNRWRVETRQRWLFDE